MANLNLPALEHVQRHSPGGADDMFGGLRTVSYPLTLSAGGSINDAATSVHARFPVKVPAQTRRWRLHVRNFGDRDNTTYTGALSVSGVWAGLHQLASDGSPTGLWASAPTRVIPPFTTASNGAESVSGWISAAEYQFTPGTEYMLALGYTCAAQTNHAGIGGGWRSEYPAEVADLAPAHALTQVQQMPLDVWVEAEISAQVPILAHLGDSLLAGTMASLPIHDGYAMKHAHAQGVWPMILSNHGSKLTHWTNTSQWKWAKYAGLSKPDAILLELGSNDIFADAIDLATYQSRFAALATPMRTFFGKVPLYLRTILPRNGSATSTGLEAARVAVNNWLYTLPGGAVQVFPFDDAVADPANPGQVDARWISGDSVHLNSAGYARSCTAITAPIARRHVDPAPVIVADTTPPAPVTSLGASRTAATVTLSWVNPTDPDFAGVIVRRALGATAPASPSAGTAVTSTAPSATGYTDTGLEASTQYSYSAWARDAAGNVATAATVTVTTLAGVDVTPPGPASAVTALADATKVTLGWTNPGDSDFAGMVIRRAAGAAAPTSPTDGTAVATTSAGDTSFVDTGLTASTQYSYAVFSRDGAGNHAAGVAVTVTTLYDIGIAVPYSRRFHVASLGASGSVTSWRDSASGTELVPSVGGGTSATAPTIATDSTGAQPQKVVSFNGVADALGQLYALDQPSTIVVVGRITTLPTTTSHPGGSAVISGSVYSSTAGRTALFVDNAASPTLRANAGSTRTSALAPGTNWHVVGAVFNGATSTVFMDGTGRQTGSVGTESRVRLTLAGYDSLTPTSGGQAKLAINIAEVLVFPAALTAGELNTITAAIRAAYPSGLLPA